MSIIGSKAVNKKSREEGTIIRVNNNEIVVSFGYGGIENKIPLDKISEYFYVSAEFMNDLKNDILSKPSNLLLIVSSPSSKAK